jgi:malonyl-CoA O-methyltransferase
VRTNGGGARKQSPQLATATPRRKPQRAQRGTGAAKRPAQSPQTALAAHCRHTAHWLGSLNRGPAGAKEDGLIPNIGSIYWSNMPPAEPSPKPHLEAAAAASRRPLDPTALARVQRRLDAAPEPPWLHGEVARRMVQRLPIIKLKPQQVIDWGSFLGASRALLRQTYPQAQISAVEHTAPRRDVTAAQLQQPWWSLQRWSTPVPTVLLPTDVATAQAQLLWSNMGLHGAIDPQAVMAQWQRALAVDGFLMFSTLGPGSLQSLSALYAQQAWPAPFAPFVDMHDLGDMLVHAGFADPVMDQEQITLTWADADALLAELRQWGGNLALARYQGLRTPAWRRELMRLLNASAGPDGRVSLTLEVVYGHAFKAAPRPRLQAQTTLPLADMRQMVRAGRHPRRGLAPNPEAIQGLR